MANELHIDKLVISEQPQSGFAFPGLTRDPVTGLVCVGPPVLSGLLTEAMVLVGNQSGAASPVPISGAITITYAGVTSITDGYIHDIHIGSDAAIARSKIAAGSSNRIVINDSNGLLVGFDAITPDRLLVSNADGIPTHSAFGVDAFDNITSLTSPAQAQLDVRLLVNLTSEAQGDLLQHNGTDWVNVPVGASGEVWTSNGSTGGWAASTANGLTSGGTTNQYLRKIDGTDYNAEWHTLVLADVTDISVTEAELNLLSGLTVSSTVINYLDGADGNLQDQLNTRLSSLLTPGSMFIGGSGGTAVQLSGGADGSVLTMVGVTPTWQAPPTPGTFTGPVSSTDNALVRFNGTGGATGQDSVAILGDTGDLSGIANLTLNTTGAIRTATSAGNTMLLQAYDVDGTAYVTFATLTANDTPTMDLNTSVTIGTAYVYRVGGTDVAVADGGTGLSSYTAGDILYATGATTLAKLPISTDGFVLTLDAGLPIWAAVAGTGTVTDFIFTNGAGFAGVVGTSTSTPTLSLTYDLSPNTTTQLAEGTNLYYTAERVDDRVAALIQNGTGIAWTYDDTANTLTGNVSITQYTDELAQDAIGTILANTATINLTYVDATPVISAAVVDNSISNSKLSQMATLTIKGNNTGGTANALDLTVSQVNAMLTTYIRGGNAFGSHSAIGLTDDFNLTLQTGNANIVFRSNSVDRATLTTSSVFTLTDGTNSVAFTPSSTSSITLKNSSGSRSFGIQNGGNNLIWFGGASLSSSGLKFTTSQSLDSNAPNFTRIGGTSGSGGIVYNSDLTTSNAIAWQAIATANIGSGTTQTIFYQWQGSWVSSNANQTAQIFRIIPTINQTSSSVGNVTILDVTPTYTSVQGTLRFLNYNPTITSVTGAHYGITIHSVNVLNGFGEANPVSTLESGGSIGDAITTISADTTLDATHATVIVDASGGARIATLPSASGATRRIYRVLKGDSGINTVTISGVVGGNKVISTQYAGYVVQSNGTSWYVIGAF